MTTTNRPATAAPLGAPPARRRPRWNPAYGFVAPSVLVIAVFIVEPILQSGWMSLHDWSIGEDEHLWRGLGNYADLMQDDRFWNALRVTVLYTAVTGVGQVLLGLVLAEALRGTTWFTSLLRTAFFFPFIASLAVVGIVWRFLLDPQIGLVDA